MSRDETTETRPDDELRLARERIAELERDNARLRAEAEQFRSLVMAATESLIVAQDGKLVFLNPPFRDMVSYSPDEITAGSFIEFIHPDDRRGLMEQYARALEDQGPVDAYEFRAVAKTGVIRWYQIVARAGEWDRRPAVLCSIREVTSQKQTEAKYRHLLDVVPTGVFEMDLVNRCFLSVNNTMCEALGYTRGELMAMDPFSILAPEGQAVGEQRRGLAVQGLPYPTTVEYRGFGKDGREIWALLNSKIIHHDDGSVTSLAVVQDITARKRREEEERRIDKLESLGVLAGGIAHDFNNLLTAILGNVTLGKRVVADDVRLVHIFTEVERASLRATNLTQQLLTFSQGGEPVKSVTSVLPTIRECATLAVRGSSARCVFDLPADLWSADVDEGQIGQVVTNLVINAEQAMPSGGEVRVSARNRELGAQEGLPIAPGRYLQISVADRGVGIDPRHLPRIFDPYYTTKQRGSGLGLATAHSIMKRHGGHLTVESTLGAGTTLELFLPAASQRPEHAAAPQAAPVTGSGRVLLMDDEEPVRRLGVALLAELGYEPTAARDGEETLALFEAQQAAGTPFDAVIVDLTVAGGIGGKKAAEQLRALDPEVRVVVMSGYSNDPVMADPAAYGFVGAVRKPFTIEQLGAALAHLLAARED